MENERKFSDSEKSYMEELELYNIVLKVTGIISVNQHGVKADGRGMRAMKIFTRQTLVALSLSRILPTPSPSKSVDSELWDISSIASLTRNLMEGYLALHYFGLEKISESEAELRFFILQLHRNIEWYNIRKQELSEAELKQFETGIADEKIRIKNHPFLPNLAAVQKKRAIEGIEVYKTKSDFENDLPICKDLRRNYRHLSNLAHPLPLSIERIDDSKGRGIGSEPDVNYALICIMIARRFLAASTLGIADNFPTVYGKIFSGEIDKIRPLISAGFN